MELKTAIQRSAAPLSVQGNKRSSPLSRLRAPTHDLQKTIGNSATTRLFNGAFLQPRLAISDPGDEYEREADQLADQVMRMTHPTPVPLVNGQSSMVQRKCACDPSEGEACGCT